MELCFDFLTVFRQKTGRESLTLVIPSHTIPPQPTIIWALEKLEKQLKAERIALEHGDLKKGVLVFLKSPSGAMKRVAHVRKDRPQAGDRIVLATEMEGG